MTLLYINTLNISSFTR